MTPPGATDRWMYSALEAMRFHEEHGHLAPTRAQGTARPTALHRVDLYTWLSNQRVAYRRKELEPWQIHLLEAHGVVWQPRTEVREALISYAETPRPHRRRRTHHRADHPPQTARGRTRRLHDRC
jgi:hypothetical protein